MFKITLDISILLTSLWKDKGEIEMIDDATKIKLDTQNTINNLILNLITVSLILIHNINAVSIDNRDGVNNSKDGKFYKQIQKYK